jgi:hypothetical protein
MEWYELIFLGVGILVIAFIVYSIVKDSSGYIIGISVILGTWLAMDQVNKGEKYWIAMAVSGVLVGVSVIPFFLLREVKKLRELLIKKDIIKEEEMGTF